MQPAYKPGPVLPLVTEVSAIYLVLLSPVSFSGLPPGIGRAILHTPVYMTLQPIRRTASYIAIEPGELLPHLVTLTGPEAGGHFLLRYSTLADGFPLRSMVLCVARTFLTLRITSDRPAGCNGTKIVFLVENGKICSLFGLLNELARLSRYDFPCQINSYRYYLLVFNPPHHELYTYIGNLFARLLE